MIAFLFIGQGAEPPWVADDMLAQPAVAALIARASHETGHDIARLLARGGRELARTEIVQPALVAVCLGASALLADAGVRPALVLGHSLGELAAWAAGGGISPGDAVAVAALRGRLMAREAARFPGGMLRLKGDAAACDAALAVGREAGRLCVGAHNGADEWVVSGDEAALARVAARFATARFPVVGAWHSPAMAGAYDELRAALEAIPRRPMHARMIANRDGALADDDRIPALLADQLVHPVRWVASLDTLVAAGATRLVAVGPGKMLRSLVHKNLGLTRDVEIADSLAAIARSRRAA